MPAGAGRVAGSCTLAKAASVAADCTAKLKAAEAGRAKAGGGLVPTATAERP